ncbi:MAG: VacJ family lipoprotein [Rickettsiales bacterium]
MRRHVTARFGAIIGVAAVAALFHASPSFADSADDDALYADYQPETVTLYNDPYEPMNRRIFAFNMVVDKYIGEPLARGYRFIVPAHVRLMTRNVLKNLKQPVSAVNHLLQGDVTSGADALAGFWINLTLGAGGAMDVMEAAGHDAEDEDFGQTLAVWGYGESAYFVLPILGPSTFRDAIGKGADAVMSPYPYIVDETTLAAKYGVTFVDARESALQTTDDLKQSAPFDLYASYRSLYMQYRNRQIKE